jgi:hypothetical protein
MDMERVKSDCKRFFDKLIEGLPLSLVPDWERSWARSMDRLAEWDRQRSSPAPSAPAPVHHIEVHIEPENIRRLLTSGTTREKLAQDTMDFYENSYRNGLELGHTTTYNPPLEYFTNLIATLPLEAPSTPVKLAPAVDVAARAEQTPPSPHPARGKRTRDLSSEDIPHFELPAAEESTPVSKRARPADIEEKSLACYERLQDEFYAVLGRHCNDQRWSIYGTIRTSGCRRGTVDMVYVYCATSSSKPIRFHNNMRKVRAFVRTLYDD